MRFGRFPIHRFAAIAFVAVLAPGAGPANAAPNVKQIGKFKQWSAHVIREGRARTCYAHGDPIKQTGKYKTRGRTFLQVTHRPAARVTAQTVTASGESPRVLAIRSRPRCGDCVGAHTSRRPSR